jgi:hypothetical protein
MGPEPIAAERVHCALSMCWLQDIESFPPFGYDLADYERLFEDKTTLFSKLMNGGRVRWEGTARSALHDQAVGRFSSRRSRSSVSS